MHKLLERQVKRYFGKNLTVDSLDENLINLLKDVSQTYKDNEVERKFLENTITVNTEELNTLLRERSSLLETKTLENQEVINLLHQYKNAIDRALIVSVTDLDGIIKYVNGNFCKISGYTKEELIGKSCSILRDINNHSSLFENLWETIRAKKIWHGTFSNLKKNGESYYLNMTIVPLLDRNQEIKEYISLSEDVTQEMVYQKELQSQQERINTIFNTQENIVVIVDEEDGIVDANRRFFEVFNFSDLIDYKANVKNISSLFSISQEHISDDLSESQWFRQFFQKNDTLHKLVKLDSNNNEQIFSIHCRSAILNDKLYYLCSFVDITELENARKKAELEQQAKSKFLANMSHEIRTPLNAIIGFSDILCDSNIGIKDKENAEIISRSAKSLMGIINDVLDISKIESGKLDVINEPFLFEAFIEQIVELFSVASKEKKIRFIYNPETMLPYSLISDATRLRQVLSNLLSNAIKFTPQHGEVIFNIKVIEISDDKVKIGFLIKDSGIGMSQEQQGVIFKPFSQADDGISRKYGGTGLGLAISSDIIKLMDSQIELVSNLNEGSEFSFNLDLKIDKLKNEDKSLDKNLKILLHCSDGNNNKLRENIKNHINKIGHISDYSQENKSGDILFCCGMSNLNLIVEEFKKQNSKSLVIYVGEKSAILDNKTKSSIDHYLELPIYGSKIYNILAEHSDIHTHVIKKSTDAKKFNGKVLVAEDNPNNQKLIEILLYKLGVKSMIASNGQEAVESYKKDKYDLILMDINMPIMDGITATKIIKDLEKDNYQIPIVALTANSVAGDKERYLSQGMDDYLSKPIEFDKLVSILGKYISNDKEIELRKANINDISRKLQIPLEIADLLVINFQKNIKKDLDELNKFIIDFDMNSIKQKSYHIKNSCLNIDLLDCIEILEKLEKQDFKNKEDLIIEFDKLNKIILFACN